MRLPGSDYFQIWDSEKQVLRQILNEMRLENGRTVLEELNNINNLPYVKKGKLNYINNFGLDL